MQIVLLGLNQRTAPVALRERVAVGADALPAAFAALAAHVDESLVLSTCNRVELYALAGHHESGAEVLARVLASLRGVDVATIREAAYARSHEHAVRHLHRVAAGLDSMIVGEAEILTQVRRAAASARAAGALGPVLSRLVASAVRQGRRARAETRHTLDAPSVVSHALREADRARARAAPLADASVLVLGAGETAALAVALLAARGVSRIAIANRTRDRAARLAAPHGAEVVAWGERHRAAARADVVVACAGASDVVLDAETLGALRSTDAPPLLCVDITVPRTVDPAVAALPHVSLIDFATLEATAPRGASPEPDAEAHASPFVEDGVRRFMAWWRAQAVVPTIARLHARADAVRDAEVARALARLPHLSERERRVVVGLARRIVSKLLHEPTAALKDDPEGANMAVVMRALFALDDDAPALASCPIAHDVPGIIAPTDLASPRASEASLAPLAPIEEPTFL